MSEYAPLSALPLFAGPPPSAPTASSEDAADLLSRPFRRDAWRKLLLVLAAAGDKPLSMADLAERTSLAINVVCARLSELRPVLVARHDRACESHAKKGLRVDGFTLTPAGRERVLAHHRRAANG